MSLYISSINSIFDENLKKSNISYDKKFSLEDGKYLKSEKGYLTIEGQDVFITEEKSKAIPVIITSNFKVSIDGFYLSYKDRKVCLSFDSNVIFVQDMKKLYIRNKIGFINYGFEEGGEYYTRILDFLTDNNVIDKNKARIDLTNKEIKNIILMGNEDLHQIITYEGNYFEWWFESLSTPDNSTIFPKTFSKIQNNETLNIVYKCKDPLLLEQLVSGLRDPLFLNDKGESALMIAIKEGLTNTISYLLNTNLNLIHYSNEGFSTVDYAVMYKNFEAVKYIKKTPSIKTLKLAVETDDFPIVYQIFSEFKKLQKPIPEDIVQYVLENSNPKIANLILGYVENIEDINSYFHLYPEQYEEEEYIKKIGREITQELVLICVFNNRNEVLKYLIDEDANMNINIRGYAIERFITDPSLIVKIIQSKTMLKIEKELPLYSEENFTLTRKISDTGSFGTITLELNNIDQKEYIIKRSKLCADEREYDISISKEILLMQKINETFPNLTSKLYGVMFSNRRKCLSLLLENSGISFVDYIKTTPKDELRSKTKEFFKKLLIKLQNLQSLGVTHDDLHPQNILVKDEEPIIIDYGIFTFYEVFSYKQNLAGFSHHRPWIPIDRPTNFDKKQYKRNFASNFIAYENVQYKNYTSDVYAIGQLICYWLFPLWINSDFFSNNGELFAYENKQSVLFTKSVKDELLSSLLIKMLDVDCEKRFSVTEALNHEYFSGEIIESNYIYHNLNLSFENYQITPRVDMDLIEKMFQNYKSCSVKLNINIEQNKRLPLLSMSHNAIYNSLFLQFENTEKYSTDDVPLILSSSFFELSNHNTSKQEVIQEVLNELVNKKIDFKPVTLFFFYIILKYRVEKINGQESFDFLRINFERFLLNIDFDFNIWNVISVIFWNATNSDPEIGNLDLTNPEKIVSLI